jgi:hypothetical protein
VESEITVRHIDNNRREIAEKEKVKHNEVKTANIALKHSDDISFASDFGCGASAYVCPFSV